MNLKQKRQIVVDALKACNVRIAAFQNNPNPCVQNMYVKNKGYQAALEDVLLLLDGNAVCIKALTGEVTA